MAEDHLTVKYGLVWDKLDEAEKSAVMAMGEDYKQFMDASKTERTCTQEIVRRALLLHHALQHLSKVAAQRQSVQIAAEAAKLQFHGGLGHRPAAPELGEGHLRPDQQLAGGGEAVALFPAAPGLDGELALVGGEDGENFIRFLVGRLPEDDGLGGDVHM